MPLSKIVLSTAVGLTMMAIIGCSQSNLTAAKPADNQQLSYVDDWLSKMPDYHFQGSTVTEGTYKADHAWIIDYKFLANNALGLPLPCHTTVYVIKNTWIADAPTSYYQDNQAQEAKLMLTYQDHLVVKVESQRRESERYLTVRGTVTNNNLVSIESVTVNVLGYNAAREVVSDGNGYVASGQYLRAGQVGHFDAMLTDEQQEITSLEATVGKVYSFQVLSK